MIAQNSCGACIKQIHDALEKKMQIMRCAIRI